MRMAYSAKSVSRFHVPGFSLLSYLPDRCLSAAANALRLMRRNSTLLSNFGSVSMKPFCGSNIYFWGLVSKRVPPDKGAPMTF